jgi:uncharacterized protein (DUF433 family)
VRAAESKQFGLYGGKDLKLLPIFTVREAARYLHIPRNTLRSWIHGRYYPTKDGQRFFSPIIEPPKPVFDEDEEQVLSLSFINLVEAHVLTAIRTEHGLPLHKARDAVEFLRQNFRSRHPLAEFDLETDRMDLFIRHFSTLLNVSRSGQLVMHDIVKVFLERIERSSEGSPLRFYPFTRRDHFTAKDLKLVVIDPYVSWGRAVLRQSGIPTSMIIQRFWAGDSITHLADDYGRDTTEIEEAIRCELEAAE